METDMPLWFWLNIPAAIVIFAAVSGIPLWLVLRRWNKTTDQAATVQPPRQRQVQAQPRPSAERPSRPRERQLTH
jgi:hypothetical protein